MKYFVHILRQSILSLTIALLFSFTATAQEITAIDFNGDIIGKVIPNGNVVSNDNLLIGTVSPDSLIISFDGKIIGGVVPQGVAIGNDFNILGKVNADGTVRISSGKVVGKVLPSGHVVNERFDIIGGVVFPGLVYNDEGETTGRLTGDGIYANNQGQKIGFVSADGYAYRQVGADKVLDGRLLSSKMIVSMTGNFIGSIVPGGVVSDFSSKPIGRVRANGFVYNEKSQVIGKAVSSGYAFDYAGTYIGFVTYNGKVVSQGQTIGVLKANGQVVNNNNDVIGWRTDFSATATDLEGKYLGRLVPNGNILRGRDVVGNMGPRGKVYDNQGKIIGQISYSGPAFDYNANLIGHSGFSGGVYSFDGAVLGYVKDRFIYDFSDNIIGATQNPKAVFDNNNKFIGISGVGASVQNNKNTYKVSPFGYVFDQGQNICGNTFDFDMAYSQNGQIIGSLDIDGNILDKGYKSIGQINVQGFITDGQDKILGRLLSPSSVVAYDGKNTFMLANNNLVLDTAKSIKGKMLADGLVVAADNIKSANLLPVIANTTSDTMAIGFDGEYVGSILPDNQIIRQSGIVGQLTFNNIVLNKGQEAFAQGLKVSVAVNDKCKQLGVLANDGSVLNSKNVTIGKVLANGQVISSKGAVMGHLVTPTAYIDYAGNVIAYSNVRGEAVNSAGQVKGCVDFRGNLYAKSGQHIASALSYVPVMSFNNKIVGRVVFDGKAYDEKEDQIGYLQPNGNVNDKSGNALGSALKYRYAFSANNKYVGIITPNGDVVDSNQNKVGAVTWQGQVKFSSGKDGYALYDMYVYDADNKVIGYINSDGTILDFSNKALGKIRKGFYVDNTGVVQGRGYRDFYVRNSDKVVIGYLQMDGSVVDENGNEVGKINEQGSVVSDSNEIIGKANTLQFYSVLSEDYSTNEQDKRIAYDNNGKVIGYIDSDGNVVDIATGKIIGKEAKGLVLDANGKAIGEVGASVRIARDENGKIIGYINERNEVIDENGKKIGQVDESGKVIDKDGKIIGSADSDGNVVDINGKKIGQAVSEGIIVDENGNKIGYTDNKQVSLAYDENGVLRGFVDSFGNVIDASTGQLIGKNSGGFVVDTSGKTIGQVGKEVAIAYDEKGNILGFVNDNNEVVDANGNVVGYVDANGRVSNEDGKIIGSTGTQMRIAYDKDGKMIGFADEFGNIKDSKGNIIGKEENGKIVDANGNEIGKVGEYKQIVYDDFGNILGTVDENNNVVDTQGKVIGRIDENSNMVDSSGRTIGTVGRKMQVVQDKNGNTIGFADFMGRFFNHKGEQAGKVVGSKVVDVNGNTIGSVGKSKRPVYNAEGNLIGYSTEDDFLVDINGKVIGTIKPDGTAIDANNNVLGGIGENWYKKEVKKPHKKASSTSSGRDIESWVTGSDYIKSFNIALNNQGDFLGDVLVDGTVIDARGNVIGKVNEEGLVEDMQGNLIGIVDTPSATSSQGKTFYYDEKNQTYQPVGETSEQEEKPSIKSSEGVFFPSFGDGGAYGTGIGPQNLGPGGGTGAGERYDPNIRTALEAAHQERRSSIAILHTKANQKKTASFDGYQKDWGEGKVISTWRVDMSQMILQDKPIPAVIARSINSNSDAPVTAYVERNVYAEEGRNVLIPAGSHLIGELGGITAGTEASSESAKVTISWKRLIRPDGSAFKFDGKTGDAQGRGGGALGYVDKQLFKKYFSPLMYTTLTTATTYFLKDKEGSGSSEGSTGSTAAEDARENFMTDMDTLFDNILSDKLDIQPITYVPAGTRIVVYPGEDLWLVNEDLEEEAQQSGGDNEKPTVLIDDTKPNGGTSAGGTTSNSTGTTGQVVYTPADGGQAQPQGTPLLAETKPKPKARAITPPPPNFSVNTARVPVENKANTQQENTETPQDESVPALF